MPVATALQYLGVGKELTKGVGVAPTFFLPIKQNDPEDLPKFLPVEVMKGSMAQIYGEVQGLINTTYQVGGPLFADEVGWPLMGVLGDITTTASRTVTDAVTTNASPNVTSATAAFTAADLGKVISTPNLPAGAFILTVTSATAIVASVNATASGTTQSLTIGAPQTHVGSLLNSVTSQGQPTSHTLTDFYSVTQARQYAGIQWDSFELKFNAEGLLEWTAKATGLVPSLPVAKPVQSFTLVSATPTWQGIAQIGGAVMAKTMDGTITVTRKMELVPGMNGTQRYSAVFLGECDVKFKFSAFIDDDTELLRMLNNTQPSMDFNWAAGSGASATQLRLHMTQAAYTKAKINRGKSFIAIDAEGSMVANTTDIGASGGYSPIAVSLGNNVASGTYL